MFAVLRRVHRSRGTDPHAGAVAVEFALVLPVLLMLVFGIIDFGRAYNAKISLTQAAREGARARALGADTAATASRVQLAAGMVSGSVVVDAGSPCPAVPAATDVATVKVTYAFTYITPIGALVGFVAGPITLSGKGVMRCLG
ncbi:MAG TPA: TadE/TadG family type IV pilus assembly protein [Actinomycetales bacterium]|nr:TadE/TadG family type IV pilus assembly protein [Actinomycetales bacterium]